MKRISKVWALGLVVIGFASCSKTEVLDNSTDDVISAERRGGQTTGTIYSGSATGLNAIITTIENGVVISRQTLVANTGLLASTGGSLSATEPSANVQNVVLAENLDASVSGSDNQTVAQSSVGSVTVTTNGYVITAGTVSSTATATCSGISGNSTVTSLTINGNPVTVTGAPNQVVFFPTGGFVMINEQSTGKGKNKSITVTALRIVVPNAADVRVASVKAEVKC